MPRANPSVSFEVAVRHFFRHLDDAAALRGNPLVSRFFDGQANGAATVEKIRSLVLLAAQEFRDRASSSDGKARRNRQFAIVHGQCAEKKSPSQLARELGISVRQCYRERAEIYCGIGAFIRSYEPVREPRCFERMSEFDFQMERAAVRTESGDFDRAMRAYEEISAAADQPGKIEALCKMVELDLELGKFPAAEARLSELAMLLAQDRAPVDSTKISRTHADWLATRLALVTAEFDRAAELLSRVRTDLARLGETCNRSLRALRAEVYAELADQAIIHGEFAKAQKHLDEACTICKNDPKLNVVLLDVLLHQINLDVSRMRPGDGQSLRELSALINRALEIAEQSRSMKHKILLANAQVQLQCSADNGLPEVKRVLAITKSFPNLRLAAFVSLMLGNYLMRGRNWRVTGVLLHDAFPKHTFAWGLAMHLKSEYLLRLGDLSAAHDYEKLVLDGAKHTGNSRLYGIALRGLAISAHLQRNSKEAMDYIEAAVPTAERYGSLTSCVKTYHWAAIITGKQKYATAAEKLRLAVSC